ncbi:phospholipase C [Desulfocucumis palustris]|uniref:Phospholipase C n=2 Tax=Desulfocucumis palustris TaxID=1898651 RepID=A0A2L2XLC7_9FIRM|nr:phospholipase C [Desulfocucumis palustris]
MCNRQARLILESDGHIAASALLEAYGREIDLGVCWADSGWSSLHHFYNVRTGAGLPGVAAANVIFERFFARALKMWRRGHYGKAMFFLGAVTHLLQDICEPHHARCSVGLGHSHYERWVQKRKNDYPVTGGGIYNKGLRPISWLKECASVSYGLFDLVSDRSSDLHYHKATEYLLPYTQRITAGFWLYFLNQANVCPDIDGNLFSCAGVNPSAPRRDGRNPQFDSLPA